MFGGTVTTKKWNISCHNNINEDVTVIGDCSPPMWAGTHQVRRANSLEKTLMLGNIEGRRRGWQRIRWLDCIIDSKNMRLTKLWEIVKDRKPGMPQFMGSQRIGHDLATEQHRALGKGNTYDPTAIRLQPLPTVSPKGAQNVRNKGYQPCSWDAYELHMSPDSCIFPYTEKG